MNHVTLLGRLVRDPEVRVTPSEKTVCTFTLAVNRFANKGADFINIVVWGKTAELCGNSLQKGHRLLVEGQLQIRDYVAKDGTKKYVTEVVCNNVEFIEKKEHAEESNLHKTQNAMESMGQTVAFDSEIPF